MGWLFVIGFPALTLGAMWSTKRLNRMALELALAAMLVGVAGYVWQGSPDMPGAPVKLVAQ